MVEEQALALSSLLSISLFFSVFLSIFLFFFCGGANLDVNICHGDGKRRAKAIGRGGDPDSTGKRNTQRYAKGVARLRKREKGLRRKKGYVEMERLLRERELT